MASLAGRDWIGRAVDRDWLARGCKCADEGVRETTTHMSTGTKEIESAGLLVAEFSEEAGGSDRSAYVLNVENREMVARIRSLLARFSGDEETVRQLVAVEPSFDALCHEYRKVIDLLEAYEVQSKRLRERRAFLEEELLTRIEGHRPQ